MSFEQKYQQLLSEAGTGSSRQQFFANIEAELRKAGIPAVETTHGTLGTIDRVAAAATNYQCTVETHWWGIDIIMNEDLTQAIATGAIAGPPLASLVAAALAATSVVTGPIAALLGTAFAAALAFKIVQIKLTDQGKGVHWPISWLQWLAVGVAIPGGVATILIAILAFFHPVPNPDTP